MQILIVEDEEAIANLLKMNLEEAGYQCEWAADGKAGADLIEGGQYDLVLLDIMLPEIDGFELLEYCKPLGMPVIFITAKGGVDTVVRGLKAGADDYVVKPFQIGEVLARIEVVLRRYGKVSGKLNFQDIEIDSISRMVKKAGKTIDLTVKEFDLLVELVQNKNVALYRDRLYERVWKEPFLGDTRTLDSHIQRLRKKCGLERQIKTVFRIGYRLEG